MELTLGIPELLAIGGAIVSVVAWLVRLQMGMKAADKAIGESARMSAQAVANLADTCGKNNDALKEVFSERLASHESSEDDKFEALNETMQTMATDTKTFTQEALQRLTRLETMSNGRTK